ncbi:MAG TPA: ATP-binding protein, partial [Kofleriaceae bacterium]
HHNHAATDILPPNWRELPRVPSSPMSRARRGERVDHAEVMIPGTERWVSINARPLGDENDGGAVAVFRDITAERAAQARMLVSERMASLGTLAAGVGHEINNPLMSVLGNLEMAISDLRKIGREHADIDFLELGDELRDAKEAAERVRNIVRDLKLFSRSDEETRGPVEVERVMESSIRMVWNEIRHRAQLVRNFAPVPPVIANESRLGQVFLNLVINAAQAIPEGRADSNEIRVATSVAADGRVRIEVSDTDTGMTPDVIAKIFTPFFTTKPIGVGTGLGLAICHQLVTAVGGEITVDSTPGRGTTFAVLLPPISAEAATAMPEPEVARTPELHGKVLVIDDDAMVTMTIRRALREHDVVALSDPKEAIRRIEEGQRFDVILCDLMMPNITGMDVHAELVKCAPEMAERMVFITGGAFTEQAREFLEHRQSFEKPMDLRALRSLIGAKLQEERSS